MTAPTPSVPSFTDGQTFTSQNWSDQINSLANLATYAMGGYNYATKPLMMAFIWAPPAPTVTNATDTLVNFGLPIANTDNIWLGSKAGSIADPGFVINTAGRYRISLQLHYHNESGGIRCARILANGTNAVSNSIASDVRQPELQSEGTVLFCSTIRSFSQGATLYASTWQSSGATLTMPTDFSSSFMSIEYLTAY